MVSIPNTGIELIRVSDGKTITDSTGDRSDLPPAALEPFNPPTTLSDTVYTHPLAGSLGTPVSDLIFRLDWPSAAASTTWSARRSSQVGRLTSLSGAVRKAR